MLCVFVVNGLKSTKSYLWGCITHLYDLGSALRCAVPQVVSVDSEHFVVVPQFPVFGCETPGQQVQDEDPALVRLADEFDAERFAALTLHERHLQNGARVVIGVSVAMGTVRGLGGSGGGARRREMIRPRIPCFETFLLHHSEPEDGGLPQHRDGPGVRD